MMAARAVTRAGLAGIALTGSLALTGCTGGTTDPTPSPTVTPTASRWQRGEFTADRPLCGAISPGTLRKLDVTPSPDPATLGECRWRDGDSPDDGLSRELTVTSRRYGPPAPRPDYTATDEARHEFIRPRGWQYGAGTPLRGLGDEAKIVRSLAPGEHVHQVRIAVRVRNLIFEVSALTTADSTGLATGDRVTAFGDLSSGALAATREVLASLGTPARAGTPATPAYRPDEVRKVRDVCAAVTTEDRLIPGATGHDLTPKGSELSGGCLFERDEEDDTPDSLTVTVEAVPPGAADGTPATRVAEEATAGWPTTGAYARKKALGDQAIRYRYESTLLHVTGLWARRGNLVVFVDYKRWTDGPAKLTKGMERDATSLVRSILAAYD